MTATRCNLSPKTMNMLMYSKLNEDRVAIKYWDVSEIPEPEQLMERTSTAGSSRGLLAAGLHHRPEAVDSDVSEEEEWSDIDDEDDTMFKRAEPKRKLPTITVTGATPPQGGAESEQPKSK